MPIGSMTLSTAAISSWHSLGVRRRGEPPSWKGRLWSAYGAASLDDPNKQTPYRLYNALIWIAFGPVKKEEKQ
jgi:hypothetical protein